MPWIVVHLYSFMPKLYTCLAWYTMQPLSRAYIKVKDVMSESSVTMD